MLSTLVPSVFQHLSAAGGRHALAEPVHLASLSLFGLVCPFHDFLLKNLCCIAEF